MLIPNKDRRLIYEYLFANGVMVAFKDLQKPKHSDELPVRNLYVVKLAQSFTSKGFLKETFAWQSHYYFLTDAGVNYLREALGASADVVPLTLKEKARPARPSSLPERRPRTGGRGGDREGFRGGDREGFRGGDREGYRRGGFGDRERKEGGAPSGFAPRFGGEGDRSERGPRRGGFGGRGGSRGGQAPAPAAGQQ
jgi:small subunit ribosomal protein S10e